MDSRNALLAKMYDKDGKSVVKIHHSHGITGAMHVTMCGLHYFPSDCMVGEIGYYFEERSPELICSECEAIITNG